jgi:uncharacterized protein YecT (DUF1311 family)
MAIRVLVVSVLFCVAVGWAQKKPTTKKPAADPCATAETQLEMNQCTAAAFHDSDKRLNELYERIVKSLQKDIDDAQKQNDKDQINYNTTLLENLRKAQRAWLAYRDLHCAAAKQKYEGGSIAPAIEMACLQQVTDHRIEELQDTYEEP